LSCLAKMTEEIVWSGRAIFADSVL
jgi:hypothetical protein